MIIDFADELKKARRIGAFKQYVVGRSSEATFSDAFEKHEAIIRCLGGFDPTGEVVFELDLLNFWFYLIEIVFCDNWEFVMMGHFDGFGLGVM